eukprot:CAMPEP_0179087062 /NCGR_PEP_ID=MMETSP0796-20121207/39535_1 /TAXON_ID=73915 /ORGANISM="Pyrodinium bahamense, Strain pbaha01" /LENGTH=171 /DNA_ID=CAMNT_0020784559 /DNA_START=38 /DNA_END=553 /DNA_ORIENTATION=-
MSNVVATPASVEAALHGPLTSGCRSCGGLGCGAGWGCGAGSVTWAPTAARAPAPAAGASAPAAAAAAASASAATPPGGLAQAVQWFWGFAPPTLSVPGKLVVATLGAIPVPCADLHGWLRPRCLTPAVRAAAPGGRTLDEFQQFYIHCLSALLAGRWPWLLDVERNLVAPA